MQRHAVLRLLEAIDVDKVKQIVDNEFTTEDGQVDFFEIDEQMENHELTEVGPVMTEYVLEHHASAFDIS